MIDPVSDRQILRPSRTTLQGKRVLDLILAVPASIVALPIVALAALLIRITSRGPALYGQIRVGRNTVPYRCYKLRTMYVGTPVVPTHEAKTDAITPVGRFLRRSRLDELPQLWNVLKGEMSLVGPRPCLPQQQELIEERRRLSVFSVPPGITGLAQLRGHDMSDPLRCAKSDAEYISEWSLGLDLRLIVRTVWRRL